MNYAEYEAELDKRFEELFNEKMADYNKRHARALICHTCTMLYEGYCPMCIDEFCDLEDYMPIEEFLDFMTTLANGSSDEAEI